MVNLAMQVQQFLVTRNHVTMYVHPVARDTSHLDYPW